ncbi:hypothetical protein CEXT_389271, partial [Caerostris extrusa]
MYVDKISVVTRIIKEDTVTSTVPRIESNRTSFRPSRFRKTQGLS